MIITFLALQIQIPSTRKLISLPETHQRRKRRRRRLLRRSETLSDWCLHKQTDKSKVLQRSNSYKDLSQNGRLKLDKTIDVKVIKNNEIFTSKCSMYSNDSPRDNDQTLSTASLKAFTANNLRTPRGRLHSASIQSSSGGSDLTLNGGRSSTISGMSATRSTASGLSAGTDQEMEYDLYDCDLDNVMAAPGSMFAPAFWDQVQNCRSSL